MEKTGQYHDEEDTLHLAELDQTFDELTESNPELAGVVEEHGELAKAFGRFALARGYDEADLPMFINYFSEFTDNWKESIIDQGVDSKTFLEAEKARMDEMFRARYQEDLGDS